MWNNSGLRILWGGRGGLGICSQGRFSVFMPHKVINETVLCHSSCTFLNTVHRSVCCATVQTCVLY